MSLSRCLGIAGGGSWAAGPIDGPISKAAVAEAGLGVRAEDGGAGSVALGMAVWVTVEYSVESRIPLVHGIHK